MMLNKNFILFVVVFFIGLGVFNSITTWIEDILSPRGFSSAQAGIAGGLMVVGGSSRGSGAACAFGPHAAAGALSQIGGSGSHRLAWQASRLPPAMELLLAALLPDRVLSFERRANWFSIRGGDHLPGARRDFQRPAPADGTDIGHPFHFRHGCFAPNPPSTGSMTASLVVLIGLMVAGFWLSTRFKNRRC